MSNIKNNNSLTKPIDNIDLKKSNEIDKKSITNILKPIVNNEVQKDADKHNSTENAQVKENKETILKTKIELETGKPNSKPHIKA